MKLPKLFNSDVLSTVCLFTTLVCAGLLVYGCYAGIKAVEVTSSQDSSTEGLRYFLPAPFLIIEQQTDERWIAKLELGVDRSREYTLQPYTVMATSKAEINFEADGTLKQFKLEQDTTKVAEAVVNALKEVQLKNLELQNQALDKRILEAQKTKSPGLEGKDAALGSRKVEIYRIKGTELISASSPIELRIPVPPPPPRRDEVASADPTKLNVNLSDGKVTVERPGAPLEQKDILNMHFFKPGGNPVDNNTELLKKFTFDSKRKQVVADQKLVSEILGGKIVIGNAEGTVPSQ
jgi:hypothetical protein